MMHSSYRLTVFRILFLTCATACSSAVNTQVTDSRTRMSTGLGIAVVDMNLHNTENATDQNVTVTAAQAVAALPGAFIKLGIKDAAVLDTTGGVYLIGARNVRVHGTLGRARLSSYIDCGSAPMYSPADTYDVSFSATSYATPRDGGATLHTLVMADGRDPAANTPSVHCTSTGAFERQLAQLVGVQ